MNEFRHPNAASPMAGEPRRPWSWRARLAAAAGAAAVLAAGSSALTLVLSGPRPSVAHLTLRAFEGDGVVRLSAFRGRPLVVNAFASWCAPCVAEMPAFERVYREVGGRVAFLGLNVRDDPALARELVRRTGVTYPLAADPEGRVLTEELGGVGMPTTVFVDAGGRIVERFTGPLSASLLRAKLRAHFGV